LAVDVRHLPLELVTGEDGRPVEITIETRTGVIKARIWKVAVGRNVLLLLDSDLDGNRPEDRELTAHLYGGDDRVRIRQELLLGVGGVRALRALGISPGVLHLNEGHSAFAGLELVRERMITEGVDFGEALRRVACQTVFTTHTPVVAGHDRFPSGLVEEHLGLLREGLGLSHDRPMSLGRVAPGNQSEPFCMTVLAMKLARRVNGVSALHGRVSRTMWSGLWPGRSEAEVPIGHITNGVHVLSWLALPMRTLYDRHLGAGWAQRSGEPEAWANIERVNDAEL
jgi:starch phosphorylase